ncbi:hypothetical protein [Anaerolinea thermophila]|uniref:Hypothetical membrane protein n=1 Tax=Anaerolinea thermophila (strain DSM 14523 / JCM 11388 / NBRC 100420 / UNI-1) TaxID=926569 RepID=E8N421_ANATU|nr:hypothetical protein [Anaerolinea thermophila]BAJ63185.1 hypothetical membrane protein [Anaerolinea thermophila UNI-1]
MKRLIGWFFPSMKVLLGLMFFLAVLSMGERMMNVDGDLGRHLTIGNFILDTGWIPNRDVFSHTMAGEVLTPHEWMAQVVFALMERWFGLAGVVWLCALMVALTVMLVFRLSWERSGGWLSSLLVTLLAMAASSLHWLTRPHLFTFLFLAIWLKGLEDLFQRKRYGLLVLPVLMLIWANTHGAFLAGFVVWVVYGVGILWRTWVEKTPFTSLSGVFRDWFWVGGLSLIASLLNPSGVDLWKTSVGYVRNAYLVGHTAEYLSPDFHTPGAFPFLLMVLGILGVWGISHQKPRVDEVLLVSLWIAMALYSARNIPLFAVVSAPVLAKSIHTAFQEWAESVPWFKKLRDLDLRMHAVDSKAGGWVTFLLIVVFMAWTARAGLIPARFQSEVFPVRAMDWLEAHPQEGNVFNYFPWGGYILYRAFPDIRVFIDGQTDFYGEALTREYEQVITLQDGWKDVLDKYRVQWALMPESSMLSKALERELNWEVVYRDQVSVILHCQP